MLVSFIKLLKDKSITTDSYIKRITSEKTEMIKNMDRPGKCVSMVLTLSV